MDRRNKTAGALCLFGAALVWGFGFVAQDLGARHVQGFTFQTTRNLLATLLLLVIVLVRDLYRKRKGIYVPATQEEKKCLLTGGVCSGLALCLASALQQFGIANNVTSPGKDAFITAMYIVLVPLLALLLGKRSAWHVYVSVAAAFVGLWLLCMSGSALTLGDAQVMCSSLVYAVQILILDHFAPRSDGFKLACIQFAVVTVISGVLMLILEEPSASAILDASGAILYAGLLSAAAGYTLQILGQRHTPSTLASLIMSLESVFAVIASAILLPEVTPFTLREGIGMAMIFIAIVASQLELPRRRRIPNKSE